MNTNHVAENPSSEDGNRNVVNARLHSGIIPTNDACTLANENSNNSSDPANSSLDKSYEMIPNSRQVSIMDETAETSKEGLDGSDVKTEVDTSVQVSNGKEKTSHDNSLMRKSGSFLSKLTSSSSSYNSNDEKKVVDQQSTSSNLPSSFANLISSVSFTSGFRPSFSNSANNDRSDQTANKLTIETASTSTSISMISETREQILNRKAALERKNLINLTKLIVKDLISTSLNAGRTIDDQHQCAIHLNNYFTLLDRVLKHGLKQNILTNRAASLWNALDSLPKYLTDKRLTSETVRSLAHTKTPDGKIRAWLRIAMMQKKLPEYFNELLANKSELLHDIYHDYAFMMNDDAQVFAGLIIGVNVIDCNFFVKDDNFDMMDDLLDISPYLRAANSFDEDDQQSAEKSIMLECKNNQMQSLTAILDQKNYLEERSVLLESTISGLKDKVKVLEEQNSRLEMEAKVNEVRIQKLKSNSGKEIEKDKAMSTNFAIPDALKSLMNSSTEVRPKQSEQSARTNSDGSTISNVTNDTATFATELNETSDTNSNPPDSTGGDFKKSHLAEPPEVEENKKLKANIDEYQSLLNERGQVLSALRERVEILETSYRGALEKIRVLEHDCDTQNLINRDRETTIKIYEKDLREKQNLVESLQKSMKDARKTNSDLNDRLDAVNLKLKDRLSTVNNLQASLDKWKLENKTLATLSNEHKAALKSTTTQLELAQKTIDDLKKYNEKINDELKKERECGQSCSNTVESQTSRITELTDKIDALEKELDEFKPYRDQLVDFKKRCQDYEQSLEEIGYQLRESRLEVESLKENSSVFLDSQWMDSKQVKSCALCQQTFSVTRRKHHCRLCGNVFCQTCSDNKMELASSAKPVRVCDTCHAFLLAKFVKSSSSSASNSTVSATIT